MRTYGRTTVFGDSDSLCCILTATTICAMSTTESSSVGARRPAVARLNDVEVLQPDEWSGGIRLARLITRGATGSDVMLGVCWLAPGESTAFELAAKVGQQVAAQETYYVVRGRVRVLFDDEEFEAGSDNAIWFAPGYSYVVEAIGDEETFIVYTVSPASR